MTDQPALVRSPPHYLANESGEVNWRTSRDIVLDFLENIFRDLYGLSRAYLLLYPTTPECPPCKHNIQSGICPGHLIDEMAGQGERLAFIGMLLRTVEHVRELERDVPEIEKLNTSYPAIARGVAILNFLTAGLCRNYWQTVFNLLQLVQALKANKICALRHNLGAPIKLYQVYNKTANNRILTLINLLLGQCTTCRNMEHVKDLEKKLGADLDPLKWHGCSDCELTLVDILLYTRKLQGTNHRMLASLRLSLEVSGHNRETVKDQLDKSRLEVDRHLFKLGLTKVSVRNPESVSLDSCFHTVSMDYEVMFISGWQEEEEKKDDLEITYNVLQNHSKRRLFYIQCKYLQRTRKTEKGRTRCCEPQMKKCLNEIIKGLHDAHQNLRKLAMAPVSLPKRRVYMLLEQDPCELCGTKIMPVILEQLDRFNYRPQLYSMMPYIRHSDLTFLERLIPLQVPLKVDLCPFGERHVCMILGHCMHVRCHERCQYSTPNQILVVRELRHQVLILGYTPRMPDLVIHCDCDCITTYDL